MVVSADGTSLMASDALSSHASGSSVTTMACSMSHSELSGSSWMQEASPKTEMRESPKNSLFMYALLLYINVAKVVKKIGNKA